MDSNTQPPTTLRSSTRIWPWAAGLVAVGAASVVAWLWLDRAPMAEAAATPGDTSGATGEPSPADARPASPADDVPPETKEGAARGRDHLRESSSHAAYRRWLEQPQLFSRGVAALLRIAEGESAGEALAFLAPAGRFEVLERDGKRVIAPATFARYDEIAEAVASIDAKTAVAAYRALSPTLSRLHREIARPGVGLDETVRRALSRLAETPTTGEEIEVVSARVGANYEFADPALEGLSAAQKQLLRMGPKNAARVRAKCRELLEEIGR